VFVGGISWKADEAALKQFFAQYGSVLDCKIIVDRSTGKSKGYGFVTFKDFETAETVKKTSNLYFLGKHMNVGEAFRKTEAEKRSSPEFQPPEGGESPNGGYVMYQQYGGYQPYPYYLNYNAYPPYTAAPYGFPPPIYGGYPYDPSTYPPGGWQPPHSPNGGQVPIGGPAFGGQGNIPGVAVPGQANINSPMHPPVQGVPLAQADSGTPDNTTATDELAEKLQQVNLSKDNETTGSTGAEDTATHSTGT